MNKTQNTNKYRELEELEEAEELSKIALERDVKDAEFISHRDAWK